ncbi:MAG: hypothetical protein ACRCU0_05355 [Candidatus Rhabdochlamydia sp.]
MSLLSSSFDPNLRSLFKEDELKNLQSCIKHCNIQLKNEQRSWTAIISDNKVAIISLVACSAIISIAVNIAVNYVLSRSIIVLPFTIAPIFYGTSKLYSLEKEASDTLTKTQKVFISVLWKYAFPINSKEFLNEEQWEEDEQKFENTYLFLEKFNDIALFIKKSMNSPRMISPRETEKVLDEMLAKHGENKGLGSLSKVVFMQMVKDQRRLDKIASYHSTCNMGVAPILFAAQGIDELISPYLCLVSKSLNIALITITAVLIGRRVVNNCINHYKDQEIGKDTFRDLLPELNDVLEIPKELCAKEFLLEELHG